MGVAQIFVVLAILCDAVRPLKLSCEQVDVFHVSNDVICHPLSLAYFLTKTTDMLHMTWVKCR